MSLAPGTRVGSYEIRSPLGAGGMGEVYRAHDHNLRRDVALKVLPAGVAADADRQARLAREARVVASLNHPIIAAIYGVEDHGGLFALVLELVDGETLAARIARGPLPVKEALRIGRAIADALDAAHERGIVHRDLKPANVMLSAADRVKVLDFGIAKAIAPATAGAPVDDARPGVGPDASPTEAATQRGLVLGTAAYMSPEQARGQTIDSRTDLWAFGCVVYEMLTGRAAFARATPTDTLAAVLEREPDWAAMPASVPASVPGLLRRCLEKNVTDRWRDAGDLRIALDDALGEPANDAARDVPRKGTTRGLRERLAWAIAAVGSRPPS